MVAGGVLGASACSGKLDTGTSDPGGGGKPGSPSKGGGGGSATPGGGGGGGEGTPGPSDPVPPKPADPTDPGPSDPATARFDGKGFVVHEWGTNTVVVGSDGSLQRGLHHEEEDLPPFVYDRIKAGSVPRASSVVVKMETPILYFYSDRARTAKVAVDFPNGVLTQWYPAVRAFFPHVALDYNFTPAKVRDPVFDLGFPFTRAECATKYGTLANGRLDWGDVSILPAAEDISKAAPAASLDRYTWSYARAVAANPLRIGAEAGVTEVSQSERFLFYRGLGNFPLPINVTAKRDGGISLANVDRARPIGAVYALNVTARSGNFTAAATKIAPGAKIDVATPSLGKGADGIDAYADKLAASVTATLDKTGLYHDESVAMVNTWKRQWFKTPGVRLLYLVPQAFTDEQIPLRIDPRPDKIVRVMMIRVEVITPDLEDADVSAAQSLADGSDSGKAYFRALGRFAEPRLRRALGILKAPRYGEAFLREIATAATSNATE